MLRVELGFLIAATAAIRRITGSEDFGATVVRRPNNFPTLVERALQRISPEARVNRESGEVSLASGVSYQGHEQGHELLRRLVGSRHTILIRESSDSSNSCAPEDEDVYTNQGSTVNWNPTAEAYFPTCAPPPRPGERLMTPTYIRLAHELGHADQRRRGRYTPSDTAEITRRGWSSRIEFANIGRPRNTCHQPDRNEVCRECSSARNLHTEIDRIQGPLAQDLRNLNVDPDDHVRNVTENDIRFENNLGPRTYYS